MSTTGHLDDEQLTALQDGGGTAGERAHLRSCSRCTDRSDALTVAAALVAAPPPPPTDAAREGAVAAALAGADRPVVPSGRRRAPRQVPAWLVPAAAVVALLALVAVVVPQLGGRSDEESAADRLDAATESDDDAGGAATGGGGAASEAPAPEASSGPDLGPVDDEAELARVVQDAIAGSTPPAADAQPTTSYPCAAAVRASGRALEPLRFRAPLVWRGRQAEVLSDGTRAVVVARAGCTLLADVDLR